VVVAVVGTAGALVNVNTVVIAGCVPVVAVALKAARLVVTV
jgi:hypothetical protein